jgi:hypothetical protein
MPAERARTFARRLCGVLLPLALLAGVTGCESSLTRGPAVPDSTLVDVLVDLHLEAARHESGVLTDSLRREVLSRHAVDSARFARTLAHYSEHPEAYVPLYDRVIDRLNAERLEAERRDLRTDDDSQLTP